MKSLGVLTTLSLLAMLGGCGPKDEDAAQRVASQASASQPQTAQPELPVMDQREATEAIVKLGGTVSPSADRIGFEETKITDAALVYVKSFPQLKRLCLIDTQVTDAGLKYIKRLNLLEELNLHGTKVSDPGLENLKGLGRLRGLNLNNTRVTDVGLKCLGGLTALRSLGLRSARWTDAGLECLEGLAQLQELDLNGTGVSDAGLKHLEGLSQLADLDLGNTRVTDAALDTFKAFTRLARLHLDNTHVTVEGVKRLEEVLPHWVRISHQMDSPAAWKAGMPIPIYVAPFYDSKGPQINAGPFSGPLRTANADTIRDVAAQMKQQWDSLPVETMYVAAIRHYDLGQKDEAVYWFYSAQYRDRFFRLIVAGELANDAGAIARETTAAHAAFRELAGEYINGYAYGNLDMLKATLRTVRAEGEKTVPRFAAIYPKVSFAPDQSWVDKRKVVSAGLSKLLDHIEADAAQIKAERRRSGIEDKY